MRELFFSFFILIASLGISQDFKVEVSLPKTEFILAEPIMPTGTVHNVTGRELTVLEGGGGFQSYFVVERLDGAPRKGCLQEIASGGETRPRKILSGWHETKTHSVNCQDEPGKYTIRFIVSSDAVNSSDQMKEHFWRGSVESAPVIFEIIEPIGIDRNAFEHFTHNPLLPENMGQLLQKYPTSTYSAYAVLQGCDISDVQPEMVLKQIGAGSYFSDSVPDDSGTSPTGWRTLSALFHKYDDVLFWYNISG